MSAGWFKRTFGLETRGTSLLSTNVKMTMNSIAAALFVLFVIDTLVWTKAAMYGFDNIVLALIAGLAVASVVYIADRGIVVTDLSQNRGIGVWVTLFVRLAFVVFLGIASARPLQLTWFEPDIEARIEAEEAELRGRLIDNAIEKENKRFQNLLDQVGQDREAVIATVRSERAPKRQAMLASQDSRRKGVDQQLREARERLATEMAGQSASRARGYGRAAKAAEAQVEKAAEEMKDLESLMAIETRMFDEVTEKKIDAALAEMKAKNEQLFAERRTVFSQIQSAPAEELSRKYGGEWKVSRGYSRRDSELAELKAEDESVAHTSLGLELVMIALSLLPFLLKVMAGESLKVYYSPHAQAAAGDEDAARELSAMGYDDKARKNLVIPPKIRLFIEQIGNLRMEVCRAIGEHRKQVVNLCTSKNEAAQLSFGAINERIRSSFEEKVGEPLRNLRNAENKLLMLGYMAPEWPSTLPYKEPGVESWKMDESELKKLGWISPMMRAAEGAIEELKKLYVELMETHYDYEGQLKLKIIKDPSISFESIQNWAHEYYMTQILAKLRQIALCEVVIKSAGMSVPERPQGMPNDVQLRNAGMVNAARLVAMGWHPTLSHKESANGGNGVHPQNVAVPTAPPDEAH